MTVQTLKNKLMKNNRGVTAIEYALIAALISVAIIVAVQALGGSISNVFTTIASKLPK